MTMSTKERVALITTTSMLSCKMQVSIVIEANFNDVIWPPDVQEEIGCISAAFRFARRRSGDRSFGPSRE
jgi:hypothetical protein